VQRDRRNVRCLHINRQILGKYGRRTENDRWGIQPRCQMGDVTD